MQDNNINVEVAKSLDDLMKVMVISGAVFMGEQHHRYNMEFDSDELSRTHLLAFDGDEPIGTMRILKDGENAKFERLAVLSSYRGTDVGERIRLFGNEICKKSGIKRIYGFCKPEYLNHWQKRGYKKIGKDKLLKIDDIFLVPIVLNLNDKEQDIDYSKMPDILMHQSGGTWVDENISDTIAIILNKKNAFNK